MSEVIAITIEELSSLVINIAKSLWYDLLFPVDRRPIEEQIVSKVRSQQNMLLGKDDQICSQAGIIQAQARDIQRLNNLLAENNKEIERLKKYIESLELQTF